MTVTNAYRVRFPAGHVFPDGHPICGDKPHGHDFTVIIEVSGGLDPRTGLLLGNSAASAADGIRREFANRDLGTMLPGTFPTPEAFALHLLERLRVTLPTVVSVTVETGYVTSRAQ